MKKHFSQLLWVLMGCWALGSCAAPQAEVGELDLGYPLEPVDIRKVSLTDNFWLPVIEKIQEKTIAYALAKCSEEGRMDNFLIAGGQMPGETRGAMPFDDTDVYKIIEGASNSLISAPDPELDRLLDTLIAIIAVGQEPDGYLTTWRTINPAKPPAPWVEVKNGVRWESLGASHELYNAGHLYEAAYTHFKATGKRNFLDIALKNADLLLATFGAGKLEAVPGHQIVESGLIKLYQLTRKPEYLSLARYFLDNRGNAAHHELYGPYSQDHLPVTTQKEVVGHAVRAMYMYAAMTDIAVLEQDSSYGKAVDALWQNMVSRKMYLTGGIGSRHDGEAFGDDYELPNLTAYNETCAAIGSVYWNHRLHSKTGAVQYLDVLERTLYNGLLSGLSLDGTQFFYPNALESDGVYPFNRGACSRQNWFDCSCCPTNLIRFLPALPGLLYSTREDTLYVNLYAANSADISLSGKQVRVTQETNYPWDGKIRLVVNPLAPQFFALKLRIPSWARNEPAPGGLYHYLPTPESKWALRLNGQPMGNELSDGYLVLARQWAPGDILELEIPMPVRIVATNPVVETNQQLLAMERGPLVYVVEEADHPDSFDQLNIHPERAFSVQEAPQLLGGIHTLSDGQLTAIPYYAWSNRGIGKMKVWLNRTSLSNNKSQSNASNP